MLLEETIISLKEIREELDKAIELHAENPYEAISIVQKALNLLDGIIG